MSSMLLALWLALDVQGTLTCPTSGEVSQHLSRLVPERVTAGQAPHAYLSSGESFVTIELLDPGAASHFMARTPREGTLPSAT